ncbi:hypothetical protein B0T16DRAFT_317549 [Cercophora newfieldiana]|uniref:DUF3074 domain-containing protein n=1 Tax=Cercophora newfieldiana TaxID=92897 RepID=A0AA40CZC8_9PEZI|nr:hypothetical protein B0T16DRAFT_317549 [Cercophora newfieldiana]
MTGRIISLKGLHAADLPPLDATPDILAPVLISILQEAVPFIDSVAPKHIDNHTRDHRKWKRKGSKIYPDSAAPVELFERVVDDGAGSETWVCRRSVHVDEAAKGTANWSEFHDGFKERHVEVERAFTPSVMRADEIGRWSGSGVVAQEAGTTYGSFTLSIHAIRHRIGKPVLKDRTFPVLLMTCAAMKSPLSSEVTDAGTISRHELPEFLVVSIPVADYLASPQVPASVREEHESAVVAVYASVERIRKFGGDGGIEWIMATASDARGVLPTWVQTSAVPGQIAKDVPKFLAWAATRR